MNYSDIVVERLKNAESIKAAGSYNYVLTHTHDDSPRYFYIKSPYEEDTMNALIAYIQHKSSEIEESYGMDQTDVVKILTTLYECEASDVRLQEAMEIDLFLNWEMWVFTDVISIRAFDKPGLTDILQTIISEWDTMKELI